MGLKKNDLNQNIQKRDFSFFWNEKEIKAHLSYIEWNLTIKGKSFNIEIIDVSEDPELSKYTTYAGVLKSDQISAHQILIGKKFSTLSQKQKCFTLYHEVGHLFYDHKPRVRNAMQEIEADTFALKQISAYSEAISFFEKILKKEKNNVEIQKRIENVKKLSYSTN